MQEISQLSFLTPALEISERWIAQSRIVVHEGEAYDFLRSLPENTATLAVTSPPYNLGKAYEKKQSIDVYLEEQEKVIDELIRVVHPSGSICWQVGNFVEHGEVFPLDILFYRLFKNRGLKLRNRIVWQYGHGLHPARRFSGRYETILWFTKGEQYIFNLDAVRVPAKYPGKRHFKGPNKGKPSGNPSGKNPSDIWEIVVNDWEKEVWSIPNVKAAHPEKTMHPCQYPVELIERCVLALTHKDDWVLDPYCGVGSSLIAGVKQGRKVIGCDRNADYIHIARERIRALEEGRLPLRPMERELYIPQGKVSRPPEEWSVQETQDEMHGRE